MSDSEWLKLTGEEIEAIIASLELSKTFLKKAVDEEMAKETSNLEIEDAKRLLDVFDKLLIKLEA